MKSHFAMGLTLCLALAGPAGASQPQGYAAKLLANPLTVYPPPGEEVGLPPVVTGGFSFWEEFEERQLDAADTLLLRLALIPFRSHPTSVRLFDSSGRQMLFLGFHDGSILGLPYDRTRWNDVEVELHIATQDFDLTVNGMHAGPFPLCDAAGSGGGPCTRVSLLALRGEFLDEDTGWADNISLVRDAGGSLETLLDLQFNSCSFYRLAAGGILILDPPKNTHAGKVGRAGLVPRIDPVSAP
jgi:hypothetical protein